MISVIVPVYRVEAYLHRCVDSILNQSYGDFELILVDDGSPDKSGMICDDYALKDSRVHVIHQKNGGVSAARNAGIDWAFAHSSSDWICFVDSDDWIHRDYLRILLEAAEKYNAQAAICDRLWTETICEERTLKSVQEVLLDPDQTFAQYYSWCNSVFNKIFSKELCTEVRFPVGQAYAEDIAVTHHLLCGAERIAVVPEKLYYYFSNPAGVTHAKWNDRKLGSLDVFEKRLEFFRTRGYPAAYRRQKEGYVEDLTEKIRDLLDCQEEHEYQETLELLQGKLRIALKSAREDGMVPMNRENMWCYLYAMKTDIPWKTARFLQKWYHNLKR